MVTIKLRGREIPLLYTTLEMLKIQEEVSRIGEFLYTLFGRENGDEESASLYGTPQHLNAVAKAIRIMGNAGLEESGQEPDLTDKWVMRSLSPARIPDAMSACLEAFNKGMESELQDDKKDEGPVDVVLEDMNKKKDQES